jgi:N-methylhydantoinase A
MAYNVAVDVGGTFTDVLVFDEQSGELTDTKVLSTRRRTRPRAW